jgi:hypothetical protein
LLKDAKEAKKLCANKIENCIQRGGKKSHKIKWNKNIFIISILICWRAILEILGWDEGWQGSREIRGGL